MLHIAFLNVGQGDTIVVSNPQTHEAIVIDCFNPVAAWDFLRTENAYLVRAVIITHLHEDHYSQMVNFLEGCPSRGIGWDAVYFNWLPQPGRLEDWLDDDDKHSAVENDPRLRQKAKKDTFQKLAVWAHQPGVKRLAKSVDHLEEVNIQGMTLEFLHPIHGDTGKLELRGKLNNLSVVLRVWGGQASALLMGDLEPDGWDILLENAPDLSCDVLKFPHHGAWIRDDVNALLDKVSPKIVVMSVGTVGHKFNHPNPNVFEVLKRRAGVDVLCTQATKQCVSEPAQIESQVQAKLATANNSFSNIASGKGCPCASTIVIELDNEAKVIYPPQDIHQQIINDCLPLAQCRKL